MAAYREWLNALAARDYHLFLLALTVLLVAALIGGIWWLRRAHWILNTPTARIGSAPQGFVEIEAEAFSDADLPLASPLTGLACVWFEVQVEARDTDGKKGWNRIYHARSDALIPVRDATGVCYLDPDNASVIVAQTSVWYGDTERPLLRRSGGASQFTGRYRYTERLLTPGEAIYALGWFRTVEHDPFVAAQDAVRDLLAEWKQDPDKMRSFDTNRDGQISAEEWDVARRDAQTQVAQAQPAARPPAQTHIMSARAGMRRPYLISTVDQTTLARRYKRWGGGLFIASVLIFFLFITAYYLRTAASVSAG